MASVPARPRGTRAILGRVLYAVFVDDLQTKAIALASAVIIWFLVSGEVSERIERDLQVRIESSDPSTLWVETPTSAIAVTLEGPREILQTLHPEQIVRKITYKPERLDPEELSRTIEVSAEEFFDLPLGVRVASVAPERVRIVLQRVVSRFLTVRAEAKGRPAEGRRVGEVVFVPAEVRALVPFDLADKGEIWATPIQLSERERTFVQRLELVPEIGGRRVHLLESRPIQATVTLHVEHSFPLEVQILRPQPYVKAVKDSPDETIPLFVRETAPKLVYATVSGTEDDIQRIRRLLDRKSRSGEEPLHPMDRLREEQLRLAAYVDLQELDPDDVEDLGYAYHVKLHVYAPPEVRLLEVYELNATGERTSVENVQVYFAKPGE